MAQATLPFPEISSKLPAEEQDSLMNVPSEKVSEWARVRGEEYKRQIRELEKHLATFHSLQNTGVPISRLPNEVLGEIFAATACGFHDDKLPHRSIGVVCRRWRDVLFSTPGFWAESISATSCPSPSQLSFAIRNCSASDLGLILKEADDKFLSVLADYHGRVVHLTMYAVQSMVALKGFLYLGCMRSLHTATINLLDTLTLDGGALPSLRYLTIVHTHVALQSVVGTLEGLELRSVTFDSFGAFHAVLEQCPRLRVLILHHIMYTHDNVTGDHSRILALDKLSIHCDSDLTARLLLYFDTQIRTQRIIFVDIRDEIWISINLPRLDLSLWDPQPGGSAFPPYVFDRICIRDSDESCDFIICAYIGLIERFQIVLRGLMRYSLGSNPRALPNDWLPTPFRAPTISVLVLDRQSPYPSNYEKCQVFIEKLPHVRRIELIYHAVEAVEFSASFLRFHADIAGELSIAWVFGVEPGEEGLARAAEDLEALLELLRAHMQMDGGKPRLGRLELYALSIWSGYKREPYAGRIDEGTDAALCREVGGPFLSRFEEVVDVVVLG